MLYLAHQLTPATARERAGAAATERFRHDGTGYWLMHVTRPQTVGYALADSPVGLLAWVYEKLVDWSEGYPWTDDEGAYCIPATLIFLLPSVYLCPSER